MQTIVVVVVTVSAMPMVMVAAASKLETVLAVGNGDENGCMAL